MKMPNHIAIVMDGNRRWSEQRRLPALTGHRAGVKSIRSTVEYLGKVGVKYLTIYGFSTENWSRAPEEVEGLFQIFAQVLNKESPELNEKNVRLRHLGRLDELPPDVQVAINNAVSLTSDNRGLTLNFAVNYGGRQEIVDAVSRIVAEGIPSQQIDESLFSRYLYTDMPDVDLLIRTGGELRLSNFLPWQSTYCEFFFTDVLWPDFTVEELEKALSVYSERQRRFGGD